MISNDLGPEVISLGTLEYMNSLNPSRNCNDNVCMTFTPPAIVPVLLKILVSPARESYSGELKFTANPPVSYPKLL